MPPKKNTKEVQKKQQKIIEDKTFGLKNKNKSKKVQQFVSMVTQTVKSGGRRPRELEQEQLAKDAKKLAKAAEEKEKAEIGALFRAVTSIKQQEVAADVDPKSVICAYFKAGSCRRGTKCKYSHDVEQVRRVAKINLYSDPRDKEKDTMENWDQAKLEQVIAQKLVKKATETEIVCKYFLDAVEMRRYGWFWECPNGATCHYRHALPPGYVLKSQEKEEKEDREEVDVGELIEEERSQLDFSKCTPVTLESFKVWKEAQRKKKEQEVEEKAKEAMKKGKGLGIMSGRALFTFDPSLFVDDADAAADDAYEIKETDWNNDAELQARALYPVDEHGNALPDAVGDASLFLDDDALPDEEADDQGDQQEDEADEDGAEEEEEEEEAEEEDEEQAEAPPAKPEPANGSKGGKGAGGPAPSSQSSTGAGKPPETKKKGK